MTEEQIKIVNELQEKINKLKLSVNNCIIRNKKYDGVSKTNYGNYISIHIYPNGDTQIPLIISKEKHNVLLNTIIDTMQAELDLLIAERDSYILSKPI